MEVASLSCHWFSSSSVPLLGSLSPQRPHQLDTARTALQHFQHRQYYFLFLPCSAGCAPIMDPGLTSNIQALWLCFHKHGGPLVSESNHLPSYRASPTLERKSFGWIGINFGCPVKKDQAGPREDPDPRRSTIHEKHRPGVLWSPVSGVDTCELLKGSFPCQCDPGRARQFDNA